MSVILSRTYTLDTIKVDKQIEELKSAAECGTNACCGLYRKKPDFKKLNKKVYNV